MTIGVDNRLPSFTKRDKRENPFTAYYNVRRGGGARVCGTG